MVTGAPRELLGVALSRTALSALHRAASGGMPELWRSSLDPDAAPAAALEAAFAALARELGGEAAPPRPVHVPALALMPSWAEVRDIALPSLSDADARLLLVRNGSRYFRTVPPPHVVALGEPHTDGGARLVAAVSASLLQQLHSAAQACGMVIDRVVPAETAWAAALPASGLLLVCEATQSHLLTVSDGAVVALRRFRRASADATALVEAVRNTAGGVVRVAGDAAARADAESVLRSAGVRAESVTQNATESRVASGPLPATVLVDADALAAAGADGAADAAGGGATALRLETDGARAERAQRSRRRAWQLAAAGVAAVVVAAGVHLWGLNRELSAVRAERAELAPQLGSTLVGRTTVDAAFRQLATLDSAGADAPRWSVVLGAVSRELPRQAYLTGFRGRADTVSIDGLAVSAARVFDAMERVSLLQGVHASSPVRRETTAEGEALDRFQLAAQLQAEVSPLARDSASPRAAERASTGASQSAAERASTGASQGAADRSASAGRPGGPR